MFSLNKKRKDEIRQYEAHSGIQVLDKNSNFVGFINNTDNNSNYSYRNIPLATGIIEGIADIISSLPLEIYQRTEDGETLIDDKDLDYILNCMANEGKSSSSVIKKMVRGNMLDGYTYIYAPKKDNKIVGFTALTKEEVVEPIRFEVDEYGFLTNSKQGYKITINDNIINAKYRDIRKCEYRDSGLKNYQGLINKLGNISSFENWVAVRKGKPYGFYTVDTNFSGEQVKDFKESIRDGLDNKVFSNGMKFHSFSLNPKEVGLSEIKETCMRELEISLNLPSNFYNSKYNMSYADKTSLLKNITIIPIAKPIEMTLSVAILGLAKMKQGYGIRFDLTQLDRGNFAVMVDNLIKLYNGGIVTQNEAREMCDYDRVGNGNKFSHSLGRVYETKDKGDFYVPNTDGGTKGEDTAE